MKLINGKQYDYIGYDSEQDMYKFQSKPGRYQDPEIILVQRAIYQTTDGLRVAYGPSDQRMLSEMYDFLIDERRRYSDNDDEDLEY